MPESPPEQLRFAPVAGLTVCGDFDGGALSSDYGPMILRGGDRPHGPGLKSRELQAERLRANVFGAEVLRKQGGGVLGGLGHGQVLEDIGEVVSDRDSQESARTLPIASSGWASACGPW